MTAFQEWVDKNGGARPVSERLGVTRAVVNMWYRRVGWPNVRNIIDILVLAKGELSFWEIINSTAPKEFRREPLKAAIKKRGRNTNAN